MDLRAHEEGTDGVGSIHDENQGAERFVVWIFSSARFTGQRIPQHFFSEHHEV